MKDIQPLAYKLGRIPRNTDVKVIGHPVNQDDWAAVKGYTTTYSEEKLTIPIDALVAQGNSGGPVINADKQVIAMVVGLRGENDVDPTQSGNNSRGPVATGKVCVAYRIDVVIAKLRDWKILDNRSETP